MNVREGLLFQGDGVDFILVLYLYGLPVKYISAKTKTAESEVILRLKSFGVYIYNHDDQCAMELIKALGWMVSDKRKYNSHFSTTTFLPGTSQHIIDEHRKEEIMRSVAYYSRTIPSAKLAVNELGLSTEDAWKLFCDLGYRGLQHKNLFALIAKRVITRCDLFNPELFALVCNRLDAQGEVISLHAIMRHYFNGRHDIPDEFDIGLYMSTFSRLELPFPTDMVRQVVALRLSRLCVSKILDHFYRRKPINLSLTRYISSIMHDDYDVPFMFGFDFKEGFKLFLNSGILPSFLDDPGAHRNTFLRWVKIFNIRDGGYDTAMYGYLYADNQYPEEIMKDMLCNIIIKNLVIYDAKSLNQADRIDAICKEYEADFYGKECCYPNFIDVCIDEDDDNYDS